MLNSSLNLKLSTLLLVIIIIIGILIPVSFGVTTISKTSAEVETTTTTATANNKDVQAPGLPLLPPPGVSLWRGIQKQTGNVVRVMFDDAHFPAFTVDPNNDADESIGGGAGGYSDFADVLVDPEGMEAAHPGHTFETPYNYEVWILNEGEVLTPEVLEDVDVLVLPCTFNGEYLESEIDAIEEFVKNGGGLFLIADHSNFPLQMDLIAERFFVKWAKEVVTDSDDYTGPYNYWIVWEDNGIAGDDNMPANDYVGDSDNDGIPDYKDPDSPYYDSYEIWKITQYAPTVQFYCSNAYTYENPAESKTVIITDSDGSCNFPNEPACLAIPPGNTTGAGRAVFITDSNVFGDDWYNPWTGGYDGDCDDDGIRDFWDEHNAEFGLGVIDWLAPKAYEVALISATDDPQTGLPIPLIHFFEPGETYTYQIEAWNLGLNEDNIKLEIENVPENWSASLTMTETGILQPDEYVVFGLVVTAPSTNVSDGDFAIIRVKATSVNDPLNATDTISSTNIIRVELNFAVNFGVEPDADQIKRDEINPGELNVYAIGITNLGNIVDSYKLKLEGLPTGWYATFDVSTHPDEWQLDQANLSVEGITVAPGDTISVVLQLRAPPNVEEGTQAILTVKGVSMLSLESPAFGYHGLIRSDMLVLIVSGVQAIEINCEKPKQYVDPGKTAIYTLTVKNNGNAKDQIKLYAIGDIEANNWSAEFTIDILTLYPGQERMVELWVTAPHDALASEQLALGVQARSATTQQIFDYEGVILTIVNQIYGFDGKLEPELIEVYPGEQLTFNLTLINHGNGEDKVIPKVEQLGTATTAIAITNGGGWDAKFVDNDITIFELTLLPYKETTIQLQVTVPANVLADSNPKTREIIDPYRIVVNISGEQTAIELTGYIKINQVYAVSLTADVKTQIVAPGDTTTFNIRVKNEGNGEDLIILSLDNSRSTEIRYWFESVALTRTITPDIELIAMDFTDNELDVVVLRPDECYIPTTTTTTIASQTTETTQLKLRLAPGQYAWVSIRVKVLTQTAKTSCKFEVDCDTEGTEQKPDSKLQFSLEITTPDLLIVGNNIIYPKLIKEGALVTIRAYIRNIGEIQAENVVVKFYVDNREVDRCTIKLVAADQERLVTFTWRAGEAGSHKLKIKIDPENTVIERNEDNNEAETELQVTPGSYWLVRGYLSAYIVVFIVIILLIVFLITQRLIITKRSKPE